MYSRPPHAPTWNRSGITPVIAGDGQAEKHVHQIQRAIERVVDNPEIGRACDEVRRGYRKHAVGSHTSYYRIVSVDMIDVVRILHQRMDIDRHLD